MKKTHDDNIFLCSNSTEKPIVPHCVSGFIIPELYGYATFELDQTKCEFEHAHAPIFEGCFLLTDNMYCYKILSIQYAEKRPKKAYGRAVLTSMDEIPFFCDFDFLNGTCSYRKQPGKKTSGKKKTASKIQANT